MAHGESVRMGGAAEDDDDAAARAVASDCDGVVAEAKAVGQATFSAGFVKIAASY